ncbi:MAG TPA: protoporphyrinogen oxidase [Acidimicrobiia bacterium]|nr:protoporphyrinogen oxidase [Acidimicrobiia bacterium]
MEVRVAIIGGGLSGLLIATELRRRGVDEVLVLEAAGQVGGVARTIHAEGYTLEPGAGTFLLPHRHLSPLFEEAGVAIAKAEPAASVRYVYTRGRLVAVRRSPRMALAPILGWSAKARAALEPIVRSRPRSDDESLADLLERRFGRETGRLVSWLAASGVFAGDPRRLSALSSFPLLAALEKESGSIVRSALRHRRTATRTDETPQAHLPVPDMAGVADTIASALGDRLRTSFDVAAVTADGSTVTIDGLERVRAQHVVITTRPSVAARLLKGDVAASLNESVTAPVTVAWLGGNDDAVQLPDGFGALVGPDTRTTLLGILFESSYAPTRAPEGKNLAKIILGGATNPHVAAWDTDRVIETAVSEVSRVLGRDLAPDFTRVVRHADGIPQYEVGHQSWIATVAAATPPGIHLAGWGYRGVGLAHLATDAVAVADRVTAP